MLTPAEMAILIKPLAFFVFLAVVVRPIAWILYRVFPESRVKVILFRVRTGSDATRRDKAVMTAAGVAGYALVIGLCAVLST